MAVIVTGTFVLPSGEVATGRVITLRRADRGVVAFGDDAVIPDDITVTADDDGQVLFDILPGNYVGFARTNGNLTSTFTLAVPDVAEIDVADIINAAAVPDAPQSVLPDGMPGQFVSYGLDGEPIAVDLPEGNLPTGVEGQVVGYGPGGVPVAVDAQAGPQGASAYEVAVSEGFVGDEAAWLSSLVGPAGQDGLDGSDGLDGASAYEVALSNGFIGSQSEWLSSLIGVDGSDGADGADGLDGSDGLSAYQVAVANGFVGTQPEWLASLIGPAGADGADGVDGEQGPAGADGTDGVDGTNVTITTVNNQAAYDAATPTATQLIVRIA